jgi:hypothetical protein
MRNRHPARFDQVLELDVAALLSNLVPIISPQSRNNLSAIHVYEYTLKSKPVKCIYTHFVITYFSAFS